MLTEYVKILSGDSSARMLNSEHGKYVQIRVCESSPGDGWYPVEKVLPKPTPEDGEELAYEYNVSNGVARKTYFVVPVGTKLGPRMFSKLKLYAALARAGLWDGLKAWLESQTVDGVNAYVAFSLAQELRDDHPLFAAWYSAAKAQLGVTDAQAEEILQAAEIDE